MEIRPFREPDWPEVWQIIRAVVAQGDTFVYPIDLAEHAARSIWIERAPGLTVVAVNRADRVLATAKMHRNQMGPGSHVATASFMVDPASRARGIGRKLAEFAVSWAAEQGYQAMQFNAVVETNVVAVRLWQQLGFRIIGTVPRAFLHSKEGYVGLHVMHRFLQHETQGT